MSLNWLPLTDQATAVSKFCDMLNLPTISGVSGIIFCRVFVTRQTAAVHQRIFQEIEDIVEFDTGKRLRWRHLHADTVDGSAGMILMMTLDQHGGQAKGLLSTLLFVTLELIKI